MTFTQAALGQEITVPTIDGSEAFKIKPGTQPGDIYTMPGKGIPYINRPNLRGDQKFQVELEVPRNLSKEQQALLEKFENSLKAENYEKRTGFFDKIKGLFKDKDNKQKSENKD